MPLDGHEEALAAASGIREVRDVGFCAAWTWIKQAVGLSSATA